MFSKKEIINDFNVELMNLYKVIEENPNSLIDILEQIQKNAIMKQVH